MERKVKGFSSKYSRKHGSHLVGSLSTSLDRLKGQSIGKGLVEPGRRVHLIRSVPVDLRTQFQGRESIFEDRV